MTVTCFSNATEKEAVYSQIRNEIAALKESIRVCSRRHNELNITARLPDELLSQVFLWNSAIVMNRHQGKGMDGNFKPPFRSQVTSVCSTWRRVALSCPRLWSTFLRGPSKWLTEITLPRSKDAPLHIYADFPDQETTDTIFQYHSHRIRTIDLKLLPTPLPNIIPSAKMQMPCLETLNLIICSPSEFRIFPLHLDHDIRLPATAFEHAPNLKRLSLINCGLENPTIIPHSLLIESLTLDFQQFPHLRSLAVSFKQLGTFLSSCDKLQELNLKSACTDSEDIPPVVVLQHLKRLTVFGGPKQCISILSFVSCPAATHINLFPCRSGSGIESDMPELENKLMISAPLHALTLTNYPAQAACHYGGTILIPTHDLPDTVSEPCTSEHDLQFLIETETRSTNVVGSSVASLLQVLPLQDLNVLELMVSDATHAHFGLFGYLPSLHTINLHPDISLAEVSQGLLSNSEWETTSQLPYWYLEIRQSRLRPRIIDVDAENDRMTKVSESFLSTIQLPMAFPSLKVLKISSIGESEAALTELASVLLLRQQLQVPLDAVYVDSVYRFGSHDVQQDLVMIRESVNSLYLGSVTYERNPTSTIDWGMGWESVSISEESAIS